MPARQHIYRITLEWTGNLGPGTISYTGYSRDHIITAGAKPPIEGSSDRAFRGDPGRWSPEDLLIASISACHKLWYLHLCATSGIAVISYHDDAEAIMQEDASGAGQFVSAKLRPMVTIRSGDDTAKAAKLHEAAHEFCFIARSVNFPVTCDPVVVEAE